MAAVESCHVAMHRVAGMYGMNPFLYIDIKVQNPRVAWLNPLRSSTGVLRCGDKGQR